MRGFFGATAAATALVVVLVGFALWFGRREPVSAEEIMTKAQAAAADAASSGIRSFEMVEETVGSTQWGISLSQREEGIFGRTRSIRHAWFRAPDHWRYELQFSELPGQGPDPAPRVTAADGHTIWSYDPRGNALQISLGQLGGTGKKGDYGLYGAGSLDAALRGAGDCYRPSVVGQEEVAGRQAYVLSMGPTTCPSAAAADMNGPVTLWLDKQTFFVLKTVLRNTADTQVMQTRQVTSIRYNPELSDALFAFIPPPGARVLDNRPQPAPTAAEFEQRLGALAQQADFPLFAPRDLPAGLAPRLPRADDVGGRRIQIEYAPPETARTDASAERNRLSFIQRRATHASVIESTQNAEPVPGAVSKMWLRRGGSNVSSVVMVLRDGTLASVASLGLAPEQLVKIAASLEPVLRRAQATARAGPSCT